MQKKKNQNRFAYYFQNSPLLLASNSEHLSLRQMLLKLQTSEKVRLAEESLYIQITNCSETDSEQPISTIGTEISLLREISTNNRIKA